jgi:hypothetical protein
MNLLRASVRYVMAGLLLIFAAVPASASHGTWGNSPGPTSTGVHSYTFDHERQMWVDQVCPQSGGYGVIFYQDANYGGPATKVCHGHTSRDANGYQAHACQVPMSGGFNGWPQARNECEFGFSTAWTLQDKVSSLKLTGGFGDRCLVVYGDIDHSGAWRQFDMSPGQMANLNNAVSSSGVGFNDRISSWKIADCDPGEPIH